MKKWIQIQQVKTNQIQLWLYSTELIQNNTQEFCEAEPKLSSTLAKPARRSLPYVQLRTAFRMVNCFVRNGQRATMMNIWDPSSALIEVSLLGLTFMFLKPFFPVSIGLCDLFRREILFILSTNWLVVYYKEVQLLGKY